MLKVGDVIKVNGQPVTILSVEHSLKTVLYNVVGSEYFRSLMYDERTGNYFETLRYISILGKTWTVFPESCADLKSIIYGQNQYYVKDDGIYIFFKRLLEPRVYKVEHYDRV